VTADASPASTGALFVIGGTIVWSAMHDYVAMILLLRKDNG